MMLNKTIVKRVKRYSRKAVSFFMLSLKQIYDRILYVYSCLNDYIKIENRLWG